MEESEAVMSGRDDAHAAGQPATRPGSHALPTALFVCCVNLTVTALALWAIRTPTRGAYRLELPPTRSIPGTPTASATATTSPLQIHVSGAVNAPGVVAVPPGARVADAVAAAGGLSGTADPAALNLAAALADGDHVHVPAAGAAAAPLAGVTHPSGPAPPAGAGGLAVVGGQAVVNLNTATPQELESLPGIGPALAERIVAFRTSNGPFGAVRDLLKVKGIGERTLAQFETQVAAP